MPYKLPSHTLLFVCCAIVATAMSGLVYVAVQQGMRQGANDPQIQMAEDAARALAAGQGPSAVLPSDTIVDFGASLAPFMVIYDDAGTPVASTGMLNGAVPVIPKGVLAYAKTNGEHRVTWQPESQVRIAAVVVSIPSDEGGFVLVGRSLRDVEVRETMLEGQVAGVWVILMGCLFLVASASREKRSRK